MAESTHVGEFPDPHEDEDEDQGHNTTTPRGTGKQSYIGEWISASIEKSYRPGTRQVIERLRETNNEKERVMIEKEKELLAFRMEEAERSLTKPGAGS